MKYCPQCGASLDDAAVLCPHCGNTQQAAGTQFAQPGYASPYNQPAADYAPGATGYIIWSIIVLLFCQIFGIIGLVFSIMAKNDKTPAEAQSHLKLAKIMCIIGTVIGAIVLLIIIISCIALFAYGMHSSSSINWTNG